MITVFVFSVCLLPGILRKYCVLCMKQYSNGKSTYYSVKKYVWIVAKPFRFKEKAVTRHFRSVFATFWQSPYSNYLSRLVDWCFRWQCKMTSNLLVDSFSSQYWMAPHNECFLCFSATFIRKFFRISFNQSFSLAEWKSPHFTVYM